MAILLNLVKLRVRRLAGRASIFLIYAARSSQCFGKDRAKMEGAATHVTE